jgi:hypothetical protein
MAIGTFAAGHSTAGWGWVAGIVLTLVWIAFSSVHYYVDFEKMRISKAKSFLGRDVVEWGVIDLDRISHLEVRRVLTTSEYLLGEAEGSSATLQSQFRVLAVYKGQGLLTPAPLEICPPLLLAEESMRDVADLFRRIEASHAFEVRIHDSVRRLPPPEQNLLLLEAQEK